MAETTDQRYSAERAKPPEALVKVGNPIFGWLLRSPLRGLIGQHLMLLHFRGRKTGSWVFSPTAAGGPTSVAVCGWR